MSNLTDDYPRGKIFPSVEGLPAIQGKRIDLQSQGIIFLNEENITLFIPYHRIAHIIYEYVPQEVIDARKEAGN